MKALRNVVVLAGEDLEPIRTDVAVVEGELRFGTFPEGRDAGGRVAIPPLFNAHLHLLDYPLREEYVRHDLVELVRPPDGLKQRALGRATIDGAVAVLESMKRRGVYGGIEHSNLPALSAEVRRRAEMDMKILYEPVIAQTEEEIREDVLCEDVLTGVEMEQVDGVAPSGVGEYSDATLKDIRKRAKFFAIHVAEHVEAVERSLRLTGKSEIERALALKPDLLVHATVPGEEIDLVLKSRIPIAVNVNSNALIAGALPPLAEYLEADHPLLFGTDNVMTVEPDMLHELSVAWRVARMQGWDDPGPILKGATSLPHTLGLWSLGVLQEGSPPHILVLDLRADEVADVHAGVLNRGAVRGIWEVL